MNSFWSSYEEFKKIVRPVEIYKPNQFKLAQTSSLFERQKMLFRAIAELETAINTLRQIGFGKDPPAENSAQINKAREITRTIAYSGEMVLLCHKRLALSNWAYDFLHEKDLDEQWERYSRSTRIYSELVKLIHATEDLLKGFDELTSEGCNFIINEIDVPVPLINDFKIARDLFSVGLEEVGLLITGRGLEGVLREISRKRGIMIQKNTGTSPACDADFYDLIETFYRLKWKRDKSRFIDPQTKSLLHFLRMIRNSGAHPKYQNALKQKNSRELTKVVVQTANALWNNANRKGAGLVEKVIKKDWKYY